MRGRLERLVCQNLNLQSAYGYGVKRVLIKMPLDAVACTASASIVKMFNGQVRYDIAEGIDSWIFTS